MTRRQTLFATLSSFAALMLSPLRRAEATEQHEPDSTVLYVFSTRWNGTELGRGFYRAQPVKLASAADPTQSAPAKFVPIGNPVLALNLSEMDALRWRYVDVTTAGRYVYANRIGEGQYAFSHIDARPMW